MTIKQQQCLLTYLGYNPGQIDGIDGPKTIAALKCFESDYGVGAECLVAAVALQIEKKKPPDATVSKTETVAKESSATGTFWDGIKYFTREEFRCPCGKCGGFPVEPKEAIVKEADALRYAMGKPVIIVPRDGHSGGSGVRCQAYNDSLPNSVPNSRHVQGKAVDFQCPGVSQATVEAYLSKRQSMGKLRYWYRITSGSWHMDVL